MGCNCGKKRTNEQHIYTNEKGEQRKFPTLLEARQAQIRNGGKGSVRTEKPVRA